MKLPGNVLIKISVLVVSCGILHAQDDYEKLNSHFGAMMNRPVGTMANYVSTGWGLAGGGGYNFSRHHAAVGEFMWNRVYGTDKALEPLRAASQNPRVSGQGNFYVITGNYRYEWRGKVFGGYFIGGGGLYYRVTNLSARVSAGAATPCAAGWIWWGFTCASGTVTPNQSVGSASSHAFGGNGGVGFTVRVGEEPYRLYVESRYHYAPNKNISTHLATVTFGIRY